MSLVTAQHQTDRRGRLAIMSVSRSVRYLGAASILLYGAIMQPTPDYIALELIAWAAIAAIPFAASLRYARSLGIYGIFVVAIIMLGLLSGVRASAHSVQLLRDLIAFLFWIFGPLLVILVTSRPKTGEPILTLEHARLVLALAGAALSVRYFIQQDVSLAAAFSTNLRVNLEYLSSEPLATFAFIYSAMAIFRTKHILSAAGFALLFAFASIGLIAVTYRGPLLLGLAMFISSGTVFALANAKLSPLRVLAVLFGVAIAVYLLQDQIGSVGFKVMNKFEAVGTNSKVSEFIDSFSVSSEPWEVLLGNGFGGRFYIQGAGTITGYTHNVISYAQLKIGYVGVILVIGTLAAVLLRISLKRRLIWHYLPEILTLLYIGLFQGAYKHFGYGLLLGVCLVAGSRLRIRARSAYRTTTDTNVQGRALPVVRL